MLKNINRMKQFGFQQEDSMFRNTANVGNIATTKTPTGYNGKIIFEVVDTDEEIIKSKNVILEIL